MTRSEMDQTDIVQRAVQGDLNAFEELFNTLHAPILNYIYRMVNDGQSAEDITQDAFIRAHRNLSQLGPPWDFKSWVYRIASNLAIDHIRRQRRFVDVEEVESMSDSTTRRPPEAHAQSGDHQRAVWKTLNAMPTNYRQALILREFNSLSYEEVARTLEVTYDTARQWVHRARTKFRDLHGLRLLVAEGHPQCTLLADLISGFQSGELSRGQLKMVRTHVKQCEKCQALQKDMQRIAAAMSVIPPLVPSQAWKAQVLNEIRKVHGQYYNFDKGQTDLANQVKGQGSGSQAGSAQQSAFTGKGAIGELVSKSGFFTKANMMISLLIPAAGMALFAGVLLLSNLILRSPGNIFGGRIDPIQSLPGTAEQTSTAAQLAAVPETATITLTPSPVPSATITLTPTLEPPTATGNQNVKCRKGPDMVYEITTYLWKDETVLIRGRNAERTWWWVDRLDLQGQCWVWDGVVTTAGDLENVPIIAAPPTPLPTSTATPQDTQSPEITISVSPLASFRPHDDEQVTFKADAFDDVEVAEIEMLIQIPGDYKMRSLKTCTYTEVCSYVGGPYSAGTIYFQAIAMDAAGNETRSNIMEITVHVLLK